MYLGLLKKYKEQYGFKLFSYSLLPNQLSLLIELKEGSTISMVMHSITPSYTKYFNNRYGRKGHLFQQRFKSVVVEKKPYLLNLISYIHLEPVRMGLVSNPSDYIYTSHLLYLHNKTPQEAAQNVIRILNLENEIQEVLNAIIEDYPEKKDYAKFISAVTQEELEAFGKKLYRTGILGSEEFVKMVEEHLKAKAEKIEEKKNLAIPAISISIVVLLAGVGLGVFYIQRNASIREGENQERLKKEESVPKTLTELNNTEWSIELKAPANIASSYPEFDKMIFKDGTVTSNFFSKNGFAASNYTLTIDDTGKIIWETMQRNSLGQTLFWHGEIEEENMQGTISLHKEGQEPQDFSFVSIGYRRK